jgi:hypothetical protein
MPAPWLLVVLGLFACDTSPPAPGGHAAPLDDVTRTAPSPVRSDWLVAHQATPVAPQGPPPPEWSSLEQAIDPQSCGTCHSQQLEDWSQSWHALGMGPGVMGQLVDWDGSNDGLVGQCNRCHAPLAEQTPRVRTGEGEAATWSDNPNYVASSRTQGLTCAGCHVRGHLRYGPPNDTNDGSVGPHAGFIARAEFQDPAFCADCHDFKPGQKALNGKLLQETSEEWARTPQAAAGQTCQSCHMPEGRHLWKGIHDPDTVRGAIDVQARLSAAGSGFFDPIQASLTLTNTGAAHRLPTYSTPQITLIIEQIDADGQAIDGTRHEGAVTRHITPNLKEELVDTRLLPGESYALPYEARRAGAAVALAARVEVWPDEAYRRFYEIKLRNPDKHPLGLAQLKEAHQSSLDSRYVVWEERLPLGDTE